MKKEHLVALIVVLVLSNLASWVLWGLKYESTEEKGEQTTKQTSELEETLAVCECEEIRNSTSPSLRADSVSGTTDGEEIRNSTSPSLRADSVPGTTDGEEIRSSTSPSLRADSVSETTDGEEIRSSTSPILRADSVSETTDCEEIRSSTSPSLRADPVTEATDGEESRHFTSLYFEFASEKKYPPTKYYRLGVHSPTWLRHLERLLSHPAMLISSASEADKMQQTTGQLQLSQQQQQQQRSWHNPKSFSEHIGPRETAESIPKIIWTFWAHGEPPTLVLQCIRGWQRLNPDHKVRLLSAANVTSFLPEPLPADFERHRPEHQSDHVRLAVLSHHGGIWLDASIILTQSADFIHALQRRTGSSTVGFHLDAWTTNKKYPILESWAFGCIKGAPFVKAWFAEFKTAYRMGDKYAGHLKKLAESRKIDFKNLRQRIKWLNYFLIHFAVQKIMQLDGVAPCSSFAAESEAYRLLWGVGFSHETHGRILTEPFPSHVFGDSFIPPIIKISKGARVVINRVLAEDPHLTAPFAANSIIGRFVLFSSPVPLSPVP